MTHPRDHEEVTPIAKGEERGAPRCETTGELKRNCTCKPCIGRRSQRKGRVKQRETRRTMERQTGTQAGKYSSQTGNEETWAMSIRAEVKAGAQVKGVASLYRKARAQSDAAHALGDNRPFALACVPDGWTPGVFLYVLLSSDAKAFAQVLNAESE